MDDIVRTAGRGSFQDCETFDSMHCLEQRAEMLSSNATQYESSYRLGADRRGWALQIQTGDILHRFCSYRLTTADCCA